MSNPTDTNQASELFELCKKVYELTGWKDTDCVWYSNGGEVHDKRSVWHRGDVFDKDANVPLYTSDYLLEKLPKDVMLRRTSESERKDKSWVDGEWLASNSYGQSAWADDGGNAPNLKELCSDTPLLALLKLTIALSEAGELK